jgi:hypothetical protein
VNQFTLKISHQGIQQFHANFSVKEPELKNSISIVTPAHPTVIHTPDKKIVVFFKFDPSILVLGTKKVTIEVFDELTKHVVASEEVVLVGPSH